MSAKTKVRATPASNKKTTEDRPRSRGGAVGTPTSGAMQAQDGPAVHAPSPAQRRSSTRQRPRDERVAAVIDLEAARQASATSKRAFAKQQGLAPSTLRGWCARAVHDPEASPPASVCQFFETPDGLRLLHRIVLAALLVIVLMGGGGVGLVRLFLTLCGLHRLVACSDSHLHARVRALRDAIGTWGDQQRGRLAATMSPRAIGLCTDETWFDEMLLVAQEPVSGFLVVEQHAARRDAGTWALALRAGLADLPVTIEQTTSDEAKGLLALAREELGVPHNSDVFHGQNELCKGIFGALRGKLSAAHDAIDRARTEADKVLAARTAYLATSSHGPGRPPDWSTRVGRAFEQVGEAQAAHYDLCDQQAGLRVAIQDLGETIRPIDLRTGACQSPERVRALLVGIFEEIWERITEVGLGERTPTAVAKAERLIASWVGSIAWWRRQVAATLAEAALAPDLVTLMWTVLIPAAFLAAAAARAPTALLRAAHRAVLTDVTRPLRDPKGLWLQQSAALRQSLGKLALECAARFQCSSSAVEGRNGYLSLRYHHLHALPAPWLKVLTVLHNYVIVRPDGTTAAERFFGQKPGDLFEHLITVMPLPARPRTRPRRPRPDPFAAAG
jgi:hypothetical protein